MSPCAGVPLKRLQPPPASFVLAPVANWTVLTGYQLSNLHCPWLDSPPQYTLELNYTETTLVSMPVSRCGGHTDLWNQGADAGLIISGI